MNINEYQRDVDWDLVQEMIDDEFRVSFPFVYFTEMKPLYDYVHYDLKDHNISVDGVVEGYLNTQLKELTLSFYEFIKMDRRGKILEEDEEILALYDFVDTANIDLRIKINLIDGEIKNIEIKNNFLPNDKGKQALKYLKMMNFDISSFEIQIIFNGKINFEQEKFSQDLSNWALSKLKWNVEELQKFCQKVKDDSLRRVAKNDIFVEDSVEE